MSKKTPRRALPAGDGFFQELGLNFRLILRLIADPRVSILTKLLPFGVIAYLLIPDLIPGPFDDAAIIWFGLYLFIELCPQEIVDEHRRELWEMVAGAGPPPEGEVIEGEFRDLDDED